MSSLKKLSLSDCGLTHLPRRWFVPMVTELRLSRNKLTTLVPEGVLFRSVKILDVSHNELEEASTLRRCRFVRHLSVCGNPFMESGKVSIGLKRKAGEGDGNLQDGEDDVPPTPARARGAVLRYLMRVMPHLEVLDSTPLARFMEGVTNEEQLEEEGKSVHTAKAKGQSGADVAGQQAVVEDEDHVLDPPDVSEPAKAPIVRREHTNLLATKKKKYAQGADVAEIMIKRKSEVSGW
nr:unnamed protein product [Trypanosoma congolense IL3000]